MISVRLAAAGVLAALLVNGCTAHKQLRTSTVAGGEQTTDQICEVRSDTRRSEDGGCEEHAAVAHYRYAYRGQEGDYYLAFVEFDDQGWFWDRKQMEVLMRLLGRGGPETAATGEGAKRDDDFLIFVFAHGWKHGAGACDSNVVCFRRMLERFDILERASSQLVGDEGAPRKPRQVVGVYIGWRGLSATMEPLKELSFWERKGTAQRVGHGGVTELLARLNDFRRSKNPLREVDKTELVIFGHSFGGKVIYSALSQLLVERAVHMTEGRHGKLQYETANSFGDWVVLVNPAFEGSLYEPLYHAATNRCYPDNQRPAMLIITSEADRATKSLFPIGRFFSTLFQFARPTSQKEPQTDALLQTVGHLDRYRTHEVRVAGRDEITGQNQSEAKFSLAGEGGAGQGEAEAKKCGCQYFATTEEFVEKFLDEEQEFLRSIREEQKASQPKLESDAKKKGVQVNYYSNSPYLTRQSSDGVISYGKDIQLKRNPDYTANYPYFVVSADRGMIPSHSDIYTEEYMAFIRRFYFRHIKYRINFPPECFEMRACEPTAIEPCRRSCMREDGGSCSDRR